MPDLETAQGLFQRVEVWAGGTLGALFGALAAAFGIGKRYQRYFDEQEQRDKRIEVRLLRMEARINLIIDRHEDITPSDLRAADERARSAL